MNKRTIVAICTISFALVVGVVAGLSAGPAATFTVNSTLDATDVNPGNGVCETAAGNGVCTLRAAVQETNALVGADTIVVPAGTYLITIDGVTEDNAVSGDLDITDDLIVSGAGIDSTIIDGNALDRIFHIPDSASPAVEITSLTTRNGASFRSNIGLFEYGAGVYNGSGTLTLTSVEIDDNYGGWGGGAIYNAGTLAATNSYITNNYSIFGAGGIHNLGSGDLTMTGSSINNNLGGGQGGGIYNLGNVTISDSVLTGNQSADGGGVYSSGALTITDSTIYSNMTFGGGEGGGMYIGSGTGDLITITNSNIHDNSATWGGGLYVAAGHVVITGSQIDSNA
ncbi:MAG: CSLREA domain-containing protein, partial [Chloroflexota bacterium]